MMVGAIIRDPTPLLRDFAGVPSAMLSPQNAATVRCMFFNFVFEGNR